MWDGCVFTNVHVYGFDIYRWLDVCMYETYVIIVLN